MMGSFLVFFIYLISGDVANMSDRPIKIQETSSVFLVSSKWIILGKCAIHDYLFCGNLKEILRGSLDRQNWGPYLSKFLYSTIQCTIFQYFTTFKSCNLSRSLSQSIAIHNLFKRLSLTFTELFLFIYPFRKYTPHCVYLRLMQLNVCKSCIHDTNY